MNDEQLDRLIVSTCHSDPRTKGGGYWLTLDEVRALLAARDVQSGEPMNADEAFQAAYGLSDEYRDAHRQAIQSAEKRGDGWQLVPTKHNGHAGLTDSMMRAFYEAFERNQQSGAFERLNAAYNAMLEAAPSQAEKRGEIDALSELLLQQVQSILAAEIECGIFEEHVIPALETAKRVIGEAK